jgi:hypothetical protein
MQEFLKNTNLNESGGMPRPIYGISAENPEKNRRISMVRRTSTVYSTLKRPYILLVIVACFDGLIDA